MILLIMISIMILNNDRPRSLPAAVLELFGLASISQANLLLLLTLLVVL